MRIIFVGKEWKLKKMLQEEILKKTDYSSIEFIEKFDIDFNPKNKTLIVTNNQTYPLVTKILSTLTNQNPVVKDNILVPEFAEYKKNSFLIEYFYPINVILVEDKIPYIFLKEEFEIINVFRYDEDSVKLFLEPFFKEKKIPYTITKAEGGYIKIKTPPLLDEIKEEILNLIPFTIFGDIFEYIVNKLPPKKISFAESCTGGMLAHYLTKVPGSSRCFDGSVVSYANEIKEEWLGVSSDTLRIYGAVSEQTVKEMLLGILEISKADYAIAISGIAGPTGGTPTKPVGTVFIGVADKKELKVEKFLFKGERNYIQYQAVDNAIRMFINFSNLIGKF